MGNPAVETCNIAIGDTIGGCRILGLIGRGGMGAVYEAHQPSLDRKVALKVLETAEDKEEKEAQSRLFQEARLAAKLNHPNIVQIHEVGEDRGIPFIIMENVEGVTLRDLLRGQPVFPLKRLLRVAIQTCRGLTAAHGKKILHRDLKPENILLTGMGEVKIADFGTAGTFFKEVGPEESLQGTPAYAAPEAILRKPCDGRADVYALGLVLYTAASGAHPFPFQDKQEVLRAQIEKTPEPLRKLRPGIDPAFAALIEKMCSKKPEGRPTSREVLEALEHHPDWGTEAVLRKEASPAARVPEASPEPQAPQVKGQKEETKKRSLLEATFIMERKGAQAPPQRELALRPVPLKAKAPLPGKDEPSDETDPRVNELCILARFQLLKKDWKKAEARFQEALAIEPQSEPALLGLAQALTGEGRHEEAAALLEKALRGGKLDPRQVFEFPHFQPLKSCKDFRRLMAQYSL